MLTGDNEDIKVQPQSLIHDEMPHSTRSPAPPMPLNSADTKSSVRTSMEKFPDIDMSSFDGHSQTFPSADLHTIRGGNGLPQGAPMSSAERWAPRRESRLRGSSWAENHMNGLGNGRSHGHIHGHGHGHMQQKSLSDAFRTIRTRKGSVSQNVHEISDALKVPLSPTLIVLCIIWYASSALTNTSSKAILNAFPKPATLTLIQFAFVSTFCLFFSWLATVFPHLKTKIPPLRHGIRYPTRDVILTTLPLAGFQIGGHLLSASATGKIPVSLVHTIKGLSPLFTVFAYRAIFNIKYPLETYLSLIPLTMGVMLACSAELKGNLVGIIYAFIATLIFVTQNIFSKRLFNEAAVAEASGLTQTRKLDKLNLLCYSSGFAFLLTAPIWLWSEGFGLLGDFFYDGTLDLEKHPKSFDHGRLGLEFIFNGTFHFAQNIIAFVLLSMVSPVTYSVASLIKRVFIVVVALVWFKSDITRIQGVGIALTFIGLYLYDRTSGKSKADRKAKMMDIKEEPLLPLAGRVSGALPSPIMESPTYPHTNGYALNTGYEDKKTDETGGRMGRARGASNANWLPPGTRQEETWRPRELSMNRNGGSVSGPGL